ncbi:MAG: cysteine dioxygenase [Caulobacter sp.]|nr:cysteine dioxygenase [Caulobacter sp.]
MGARQPDTSAFGASALAPRLDRLRDFVVDFAALLSQTKDEARILDVGRTFLADLVAHDDWLPEAFARPDPIRYAQHLLHCDSLERFSVVSFVWGPGQATPVHDHTVWGLVGVLRGAELEQPYLRLADAVIPAGPVRRLRAGEVAAVSPTVGDIHQVTNAYDDRVSVSIHVYGDNIGAVRRHAYDRAGRPKPFISGYANTLTPNLWGADAGPRRTLNS